MALLLLLHCACCVLKLSAPVVENWGVRRPLSDPSCGDEHRAGELLNIDDVFCHLTAEEDDEGGVDGDPASVCVVLLGTIDVVDRALRAFEGNPSCCPSCDSLFEEYKGGLP